MQTLTESETEWLKEKRRDLKKWLDIQSTLGHPDVSRWDVFHYFAIIDKLQRENRKLKTQLEAKS